MSVLAIPNNRTSNSIYHAEAAIKSEEEATFEAEWDPEAISSDEAERFVAQIDARIVAQRDKEPPTPASERIYSQIVEKSLKEEYRPEDIARIKRTKEVSLELQDPTNDSL